MWGRYTLTVTEIATGKVVLVREYENMSGTAMQDEAYHYRREYGPGYKIDW